MFWAGSRTSQRANLKNPTNTNAYGSRTGDPRRMDGNGGTGVDAAKSAADKKRMLSRDEEDERELSASRGILEQSISYADSLREARTQKKNTTQKLKKLRYSYKSISSQLLRSRTSLDAAKVARKARRELVRLKGKRLYENGKYDSYELEAAITHAQAMVRVARKKVKHLQEEELMKVKGGPCAGELEENKEQENELTDEERAYLERLYSEGGSGEAGSGFGGIGSAGGNAAGGGTESAAGSGIGEGLISQEDMFAAKQEQMQAYEEAMRQSDVQEDLQMMEMQRAREASGSMMDAMSELTEEMSDSMGKLLEELGLWELAEDTASVSVEMDPADYKMMKLKHRLEEMKAIAEADAEYLKAVFQKLGKEKEASARAAASAGSADRPTAVGNPSGGMVIAANSGGAASAQGSVPAAQAQAIDVVSTPDAVATVATAPVEGGSVDVSV